MIRVVVCGERYVLTASLLFASYHHLLAVTTLTAGTAYT